MTRFKSFAAVGPPASLLASMDPLFLHLQNGTLSWLTGSFGDLRKVSWVV